MRKFDWQRFLLPAFETVGLHKDNDVICTMQLAKQLYPNRGRAGYNLDTLCADFGGQRVEGHHRACTDATWTASLFLRLLDTYRERYPSPQEQNALSAPVKPQCVDFNEMEIRKVAYYEPRSKRSGGKIYVYTNFGKICYSIRRRLWTVVELWPKEDAPAQRWGAEILRRFDMDAVAFAQKYCAEAG